MKIKRTNSTLITIIEFDWLPFNILLNKNVIEDIKNRFGVSIVEVRSGQNGQPILHLEAGIYSFENINYAINRIEIEDRRIIIEIEGHSNVAQQLFSDFLKYTQEISGKTDEPHIVIQSKESLIVAKMEFYADKLIDQKLIELVGKSKDVFNIDKGEAIVNTFMTAFRVEYISVDNDLKDHRVTLSRKEFSIGPRDGTALSEQVFVSKAPLGTDEHIAFLEEVEKAYS